MTPTGGPDPPYFTKAQYLAFWAPRIGDDAALVNFRASRCALGAWMSMALWFPSLVIGGRLH